MKTIACSLVMMLFFLTVNLLFAQEINKEKILSNETPQRYVNTDKQIIPVKPPMLLHNNTASRSIQINIIESQSFMGHDMDVKWQNICTLMGHLASVEPQTFLDDIANLASTDILIVSSGVIDIPQYRRDVIQQFVTQGGTTYIQSEYLAGYQANQTFMEIVNNLGGSFSWLGTTDGDLAPMNIFGTIATTPNSVPSLSYFWYGCYGTGGSYIFNYMEYMGNYYGFVFTPPDPSYGMIITNSDQDWAREAVERDLLMENHIQYLIDNMPTGIDEQTYGNEDILGNNFPNPFNGNTVIPYSIEENALVSLKVFDLHGNLVELLVNEYQSTGDYMVEFESRDLPSGFYYYVLDAGNIHESRKMMITK